MTWLFVAISTYFLFAIVDLVAKYLLGGLLPSPKIFAFYVGALGILALAFIPFFDFFVPDLPQIFLAILTGMAYLLGIFVYFNGLKKFEASRIVPAVGGLAPLFTFGLTYLFSGGKDGLSAAGLMAFILLVSGSVIITWEKAKSISLKSLKISVLAAFLFALYYSLAKSVYLEQPFLNGFIWTRVGAFLIAISFLFSKEIREELFIKRKTFNFKTWAIFLPNEIAAAGGFILQNWAIALVGTAYVAIVSALGGLEYVFVLILVIILSLKFPQILKEEISRKIIFQKIVAILLIGAGLVILAFNV